MRIKFTHIETNEVFQSMDYDLNDPRQVKYVQSLQRSIFECLNGVSNFIWIKTESTDELISDVRKQVFPRQLLQQCLIEIPDVPELDPARKTFTPRQYDNNENN